MHQGNSDHSSSVFIVYRVRTKLESSGGNLGGRAAANPPSRKSDEFSEILT